MKVRLLCIVALAFLLMSTFVSCSNERGSRGLHFEETNGGYTVYQGSCTENSIVIPSTYKGKPVIAIGDSGFKECKATSISIPDSVLTIGEEAFYNTDLIIITLGNGVQTIEDKAFYLSGLIRKIFIPASVTSIGAQAFVCYKLDTIEVDSNNQNFKSIDGVLYSKDGKTLIAYPEGKDEQYLTISDGVEHIGEYAFWNNTTIHTVTFPDTVLDVGKEAFYQCANLTWIDMGNGLQTIGEWAFAYCNDIIGIEFSESLKTIKEGAFAHSDSTKFTQLDLPGGVTEIGDMAFKNCFFLTHVNIPSSVKSIGAYAFEITQIETIRYEGTRSQWNGIIKKNCWNGYNPMTVYCSDGKVTHRGN